MLQTPIFRDLTTTDIEELLPDLRNKSFSRGQVVWLEGDPADALFVLAEGQLKSYRIGRGGRELIVLLQSAVDVAGEVGLFHPSAKRRVNVSAMSPTRCLTISRAPLVAFLARHPDAMVRMLERLSTIAARAAYSLSSVAFDDIARRVAGALLSLAQEFGEPSPDKAVRIRLRLSQGALAALVAASRENVNRALSGLVSSGVVSHHNGHFHVHDLAALEQAATAPGELG